MNHNLVKKLKDVGFLKKEPIESRCRDGEPWGMCCEEPDYIPTLSELIEACGDDFSSLHNVAGGFRADGSKNVSDCEDDECPGYHSFKEMGDTPEEAMANLWLELNKDEI